MAGKNIMNSVMVQSPPRNSFDLTHDVKYSANMGELIPIACIDCVPGDSFNLANESLVRLAPMVAPIMHRLDVYTEAFFVPYRLLWSNWEEYITYSTNNTVSDPLPAFPTLGLSPADYTRLYDYFGIERPSVTPGNTYRISALPIAAYNKIWYEYYRDQNLQPESLYPEPELIDGDNDANGNISLNIRRRAWEHDYFTSALPWPQAGGSVDVPLGEVELKSTWGSLSGNGIPKFRNPLNASVTGDIIASISTFPVAGQVDVESATTAGTAVAYDPMGTLQVGPTSINDLRRAFRLQEWLEKSARGGRRYSENIQVHFDVRPQDARLQRPEFIFRDKTPIVISEVLNTTGTEDAPQGNMSGHGIALTNGRGSGYYCHEHGCIIILQSVMPKTAYQQGIPKMFRKINDPFEFYWPSFANIGEQEVLQSELYVDSVDPDEVFGYLPRYTEYKYESNRVAGDFRTSLDFWHMSRKFATEPVLNEDFVTADPTHRVFAVTDTDEHKLWIQTINKIRAVRAMPVYGTPTF